MQPIIYAKEGYWLEPYMTHYTFKSVEDLIGVLKFKENAANEAKMLEAFTMSQETAAYLVQRLEEVFDGKPLFFQVVGDSVAVSLDIDGNLLSSQVVAGGIAVALDEIALGEAMFSESNIHKLCKAANRRKKWLDRMGVPAPVEEQDFFNEFTPEVPEELEMYEGEFIVLGDTAEANEYDMLVKDEETGYWSVEEIAWCLRCHKVHKGVNAIADARDCCYNEDQT